MAGAVLEQHPERARLFMQWKEMGWPLMWDPFNILELGVVPATVLVGPDGTIRLIQPLSDKLDDIAEVLLDETAGNASDPIGHRLEARPMPSPDAPEGEWSDYAVDLALWGGPDTLDDAVEASKRAIEGSEGSVSWFRSGVIHRMRHDSTRRRPGDFKAAVEAWTRALELDPNNYIWRRRLQQYGPRLVKPYPFYDWVPRAREEISARGERPVELLVEPGGAEFAQPSEEAVGETGETKPGGDPEGRVLVDTQELIEVEAVSIPKVARPGGSFRVHLAFHPDTLREAHWNNEAGPSEVWVTPPPGWGVSARHQVLPSADRDVSDEIRHIELELGVPDDASQGEYLLDGYALYYVCESKTGTCLYRRRNLEVPVQVDFSAATLS